MRALGLGAAGVGVTSWHRTPKTCTKVPGATRLPQTNTFPTGEIVSPGKIQRRDGAGGAGLAPGWGTGYRHSAARARREGIYLFFLYFLPHGCFM